MRVLCMLSVLSAVTLAQTEDWDVQAPPLPLRTLEFSVSEGTWISCDVHPDGSELVFDLLGDIYVLPLEGGEARCIRAGLQWDIQPRYSPDGRLIAYTSDQGGGDNIWVMERDGSDPRAVSDERFRLLNNPGWSPDGRYLVARKHFTSRRSLGAGEMWMYPFGGGPGLQLTTRKNDQQDAGEPVFSPDGRFLYWSEDVSGGDTFEYNKDPNGALYAIFRKDLESGEIRRLVAGLGGAVRPQPSPDGRWLAYVRRVRNKSVLMRLDLESGESVALFDGLSKDAQETWAIFGVHPGFGWTPDSRALVFSAQGRLWKLGVDGGTPAEIPFHATVRQQLVETLRQPQAIDAETRAVKVCRGPVLAPDAGRVVFEALGRLWERRLPDGEPVALTGRDSFASSPSFAPSGALAWTSWHDTEGGRVWLRAGDETRALVDAPGAYLEPRFSPDGRWLVYRKLGGDRVRGSAFAHEPGIYLVAVEGGAPALVSRSGRRPRFAPDGERVLYETMVDGQAALVSVNRDGLDRRVLATSRDATAFELSPDGRWLAFRELWNAYVCPFPRTGEALAVGPGMRNLPVARLSRDAGDDLRFTEDSRRVTWGLADSFHVATLDALFPAPFGAGALPEEPWTNAGQAYRLGFEVPCDRPTGSLWLRGGRVITMRGDEVLEDGVVHVEGRRIAGVYTADAAPAVPEGATVLDLEGRALMPGLIDVHAHIRHGGDGLLPQQNWMHLANLSFGVTTTHDPSNDTRTTFAAAELQATGAILGPRIFSTGTILYGADGNFRAEIDSLEDARSHIRRTAAFGAFSVKSYNQPRRDQRQQVLVAARELGVMVMPEGGSTLQHNLNQIADGHTTLEHNLAVAPLYEDVLTLFSESGTAYTPTLVVCYGGPSGEYWFYQHQEVFNHTRLLRWMPRSFLDQRARRRTMLPEEEFHHKTVAAAAAELARRGTLVEVGGHGQLQGLAAHWEMRALAQGGMAPHDALRAGTIWAARGVGLDGCVGSVEAGKLADLVIVDGDPLEDVAHAEAVRWVVLNGRLYDGRSLEQLAPDPRPLPPGPDFREPVLDEDPWLDGCLHGR